MLELLRRNPKFIAGSIVVGIIIIMGVIGSMVTPGPLEKVAGLTPEPPSRENPLGTTQYGYDVLAQLRTGIRNSLFVGVIGGGLGTLIAVLLGALGAYKGGLADETSNLITNIVMVFPLFPALIVMAALLDPQISKFTILGMKVEGRSILTVGIIIALTSWPWAARCIRSQVLSLKEREFVNLARMSGMRSAEVVMKEVLPNMLAYIIMVFVLLTGGAMLAEAWLSVIGLGPAPWKDITLGGMIYNCTGRCSIGDWRNYWWWYVPPGLVLTIFLSAIFVMHAGMDQIFNPRLRSV